MMKRSEEISYTPLQEPISITNQNWPTDTQPLVSISCVTYNHGAFIRDAIEGFLMQKTTFPVEILIHDDASTDRTADTIRQYEEKYPALILPIYQTENQFSKGIKNSITYQYPRARGKFIALCEGDDFWMDPMKLQKQVEFLEMNPDYVICYHNSQVIDVNYNVIQESRLAPIHQKDASSEDLKKAFKILMNTMCFRNCIKEFPPEYTFSFGGDKFITSLLGHYGKGKYLDNIIPSRYRAHSGGINLGVTDMKQKHINMLRTRIALFQYYDRIKETEIRDFYLTLISDLTQYIIRLDKQAQSEPQEKTGIRLRFLNFLRRFFK